MELESEEPQYDWNDPMLMDLTSQCELHHLLRTPIMIQTPCQDWRFLSTRYPAKAQSGHVENARMAGGYRCSRCGSENFYDARVSANGHSSSNSGAWTFVPREPAGSPEARSMGRKLADPGGYHGEHGERAESETMTHNTVVGPDTLQSRSQCTAYIVFSSDLAKSNATVFTEENITTCFKF